MRILTCVLLAIAVLTSACATSPASGDSPATDLQVLRLGVKALTDPRPIAGDVQHLDEAETDGQVWDFAGDAEEAHWLSERDKARTRQFVDEATAAIEESRRPPCRWWQFVCRARR